MRAALGLAGVMLLAGLGPGPSARAVDATSPDPVRILLVGDSVTQGSSGDWTWRYRLWRHFVAAGVPVDFVGPRSDLWDNLTDQPGSMAYADPRFDKDHAARWGMQAFVPDVPAGRLVEDHRPDVVVVMLGVNDLLYGASPEAVAGRTVELVDEVHAADLEVDVVLAEATQTWFPGVTEFNDLLDDVASEVDDATGQVVVARTAARYASDADTWDTSHPNAQGEVKIAAAVADGLSEVGVGPPASRPLPAVPVGPRSGAEVTAVAGDGFITLAWTGPPGATAQLVWGRDVTADERWHRFPFPVTGVTWTARYLTNGHRYRYRLQPMKGDDAPDGAVFSNIITAVPFRPPAAPSRLRAEPRQRCTTLTWREPAFATRYTVARRTPSGWRALGSTQRPRFIAERLPNVPAWQFRVRAWHRDVAGQAERIRVLRGRSAGSCE
ncbi:GDSL-type esterase/lipase family protein [Nocardioides sp. HM23]|uniref:GDSL-type esterase/lipase family protein n=1 Tax=Nocardioides bizhenqiangii TaxID=3095076 RepID=UPI002ACA5D76|nr:GDSL-type esterase/lipase family protein [Nocardioides sp. HM23]MDZ5620563.1 GDSL-type esterase/lipase family protein [Nocardioides sp. HM23]